MTKPRILIVEDDAALAAMIRGFLGEHVLLAALLVGVVLVRILVAGAACSGN